MVPVRDRAARRFRGAPLDEEIRPHGICCHRGEPMPNDHKSEPTKLAASSEISKLVRAFGITRDQARRLVNKVRNHWAKLSEAARTLTARTAMPRAALDRMDRSGSCRRVDGD